MNLLNKIKRNQLFIIIYWLARISLGLAFILSGIRKLPFLKFTELPVSNPVGYYFDAMHQTGFYWNFIGLFQIVIGILIYFNRFVVLSVLLMMPVTFNIFLVSIALQMKGTPIITSAMLIGNSFLLYWYFENYKYIFKKPIK